MTALVGEAQYLVFGLVFEQGLDLYSETQYNGGPATIVGARSSSVFSATSLLPNVEVVDVTYRSSVSSRDECNFRYVTINGFPQSPITNRRGSARCSARVTGFDFGTGDSLVRFTMDR